MSDSPKAVFLSYASQDAEAVSRIAEALRASGVEVWFDRNELVGGDAWDRKIRTQIRECALFVPVISAATQARGEGYFRLEWKLAVDRSHLMAPDQPFLLPIVIDDTPDAAARVVDEFRAVQWTRLPAGETPPAFCARVKKLLGGEVASASSRPFAEPAKIAPPPAKRAPWLVPAIIGTAAIVALAIWQPWKKSASAPATPAATATLTDAQQLVAKAQKIFDEGDELNRETYALADDLLKKAEALDLTDGAMWALHARVSAQGYIYGLEASPARREAMLMQAARAAKLAPDSLAAALASASVRIALRQELPVLQESLKKLAAANGNDPQILRLLVRAYGLDGKSDEASEISRQVLRLADDPRAKADLVNYLRVNNRFAEAEAELESALRGRMNARLWAFDAWLKLTWRGDAAAAAAALQKWPRWFLDEDRGAGLAAMIFMWNHEPAKAIEVLRNFPRDELNDTFVAGPRAAFTALAREQSGQTESARADWQVALQVAERKLGAAPDDGIALHWKAWALARLGDSAAATASLDQLREKFPSLPSAIYPFGGLSGLALTVGQSADAFSYLRATLYSGTSVPRPPTKGVLRLNPVFTPVRGDPRFQALIDAAPGPEEKKENKTSAAVAPAASEKSLVVLPLENLSPDPENAFFTDGMHAEIISTLSQISDLKVISRNSALAFKGSTASLAEIAQKLGVANVLTGSVRRAGNTVRIQLELRRASDEALLWSLPKGDRDLKDVLGLQGEVADQVARVLQAREAKGSFVSAQFTTKDPRAYDLFLKANAFFDQRGLDNQSEAIRLAEEALRIDPGYATAATLLSHANQRMYALTINQDPEIHVRHAREAKRWGEVAQKLMPGGAGDGALSIYYSEAERDNVRSLALAENMRRALPNDAESYNYLGVVVGSMGRLQEAVDCFVRAEEINPQVANYPRNLVILYSALRRVAECRAAAERYERLGANNDSSGRRALILSRFTTNGELPSDLSGLDSRDKALWLQEARRFEPMLAEVEAAFASGVSENPLRLILLRLKCDALKQLGRNSEAEVPAREAVALATKLQSAPEVGPTEKPGWLAQAYSRAGRIDEAIAAARRYVDAASPTTQTRTRWQRETFAAEIYAYANRPRECVELLAKLLRVPCALTVPMLKVDPIWDNVREDAAFKALLADPKNSAAL